MKISVYRVNLTTAEQVKSAQTRYALMLPDQTTNLQQDQPSVLSDKITFDNNKLLNLTSAPVIL